MASRVVIQVNLERAADTHHGRLVVRVGRAEDTHRRGVAVASRVNQVAIQAHGAAANRVRVVVDQERVGRAEAGVQVQVIHTVINLAMEEDIQMEEDTIVDIMDMEEVTLAAQVEVGHPVENLARAVADHRGLLVARAESRAVAQEVGLAVERVASLDTHHLLPRDLGIHPEVVTLNHPTLNLPTVVVQKMMVTTLVDTEANGTRAHLRHQARGHLVASRVRAEEVLAHLGAHRRRVNLASLDTEEI